MDNRRATVIFNDAGMKLIAIECLDCTQIKTKSSYRFVARIEPEAVIVCHQHGHAYAMDMNAQPVLLEALMRDVPGLARMLRAGGDSDS